MGEAFGKKDIRLYAALPLGGAGMVLLLLSLVRIYGLELGGPADRLAIALLLLVLVMLSVLPLRSIGCSKALIGACLLPIATAIFLRVLCLDHITPDYQVFLSQWAAAFRTDGGFSAIRNNIGNYNAPYLYFLAAISYTKFPDLYAIKLFSICFDLVLAWGGLRLTKLMSDRNSLCPVAAYCLLLLLPTVILNGAYWGQCDVIYSALVLHAIASALDHRPASSVLLLAVAFSFKLQTVFLIPLWCILWYARRIKLHHLLLFPIGYIATITPALLLGKPLSDILGVYVGQMGEYTEDLTLNAPSVYSLFPNGMEVNVARIAKVGILAAFVFVFLLLALLFPRRKQLGSKAVLAAAVLLAVGVPFLLPYMHDRYFFLADVLTAVWACADSRRVFLAAGVQVASLGSYHAYLKQQYLLPVVLPGCSFPLGAEAVLMLAVLVSAAVILQREIRLSQA